MTDANHIDGIAHNHGNTAAPSAGIAAAGSLIDEALALSRQVRPYPSEATLADMAASIPEGTPTRAVLDAWLYARRHGAVNPVLYLGVDAWGGMRADIRESIGKLITLVRSEQAPPDEVVWCLVWIPEADKPTFRVTQRDEEP